MNIQEIYTKYKIMPSLQLHQYRVAGVAMYLCERVKMKIDTDNIIAACLLHDMGNIIKFKLELFPDFLQPEGYEYWDKIQTEFKEEYGSDEHVATMAISQEIFDAQNTPPHSSRVLELIEAIGFSNARENFEMNDFGRKIAAYADMRVEPHGVTNLEHRLLDGNKRFVIHKPGLNDEGFFKEMGSYLSKIEEQLFEDLEVTPDDITEKAVSSYFDTLKHIDIK